MVNTDFSFVDESKIALVLLVRRTRRPALIRL
jgi:hypothetical protein